MPLNLSNRDQNSGHLFYNRRLKAAITRFSVRMKHDDRKQQAAMALSILFLLIGVGWMALLHIIKPAGLVGQSQIIGNRDTGGVYARIDGRLYPALNLTSARLAVGNAAAPSWVKSSEIAKYPTGPMIGIPGVPDTLEVSGNTVSAWTVCDTAPALGSTVAPQVTAIAGTLGGAGRATPVGQGTAILARHRGGTYVLWGGHRSQIDPLDRAVTFNLGLDPGQTRPIEISNALFNAIPATEPLVMPFVQDFLAPSPLLPDTYTGTVFETRDSQGGVSGFYVLLADGLQKISGFVADLLRTAAGAAAPKLLPPDKLVSIPAVHHLDVDYYPPGKLEFLDTDANPVTCLSWQKQTTDPQAAITMLNGRGLPVSIDMDSRLVHLVRNDRGPDSVEADQVLVLPGAANFVATTSAAVTSGTRESLFWISPQGVRYGIDWEQRTLSALGMDTGSAVQAPWPIVRIFAAGPAISRDDALLARDTVSPRGAVAPAPGFGEQFGGPSDLGGS